MIRVYSDRPAKGVQRRLVAEVCRRLGSVLDIANYQYVGFGGIEFVDFVELHLSLGIRTMTSIERDSRVAQRAEFNKPYLAISLRVGEARDELPSIDWNQPAIVWLDYTHCLNKDMLRDVEFVIAAAPPGSVLVVTVNSTGNGVDFGERLEDLNTRLENLVPDNLTPESVEEWGMAAIQCDVLRTRSQHACRTYGKGKFFQLFNFGYADGAKMLTWGGVIADKAIESQVGSCRFDDLGFVHADGAQFSVKLPDLTKKEFQFVASHVAAKDGQLPELPGISGEQVRRVADLYRWYPA